MFDGNWGLVKELLEKRNKIELNKEVTFISAFHVACFHKDLTDWRDVVGSKCELKR